MARLKLTIRARQDINELAAHIAIDNPQKASLFVIKLIKKCQLLADHPQMGRPRKNFTVSLRSTVFKSYTIFYQIIDDNVEITRVLHGARDIERILGGS